jgi:hypothetical protein
MNKTLKSFVEYCEKNSHQRFWEALRNWSSYNFIYGSKVRVEDCNLEDTFYFEERDK